MPRITKVYKRDFVFGKKINA